MFSGIASYLFGGSEESSASKVVDSSLKETEIKGLDGDEWILIDSQLAAANQATSHQESDSAMSCGSSCTASEQSESPCSSDFEGEVISSSPTITTITTNHEVPQKCEPSVAVQQLPLNQKQSINNEKYIRKQLAKPVVSRKAPQPQKQTALAASLAGPEPVDAFPALPGLRTYAQMAAKVASTTEQPRAKSPSPSPVAKTSLPILIVAKPRQMATQTKKKSNRTANGTMEGSWFVTPPPCFTRPVPNTFMMESSPLGRLQADLIACALRQ